MGLPMKGGGVGLAGAGSAAGAAASLALRVLGLVTVPSPSSELLLEREDLGSSLLCDALAMVVICRFRM